MSHQHAPSISFKQSSSASNGTPPFLSVFASHQTSLEQDYLWFMEGRYVLLLTLFSPNLAQTLTSCCPSFAWYRTGMHRVRLEQQLSACPLIA